MNFLDRGFLAWANFWGVILPWIIAIPFYPGGGVAIFMNWTTLIVNSIVNFILPPIIFLKALKNHSEGEAERVFFFCLTIFFH